MEIAVVHEEGKSRFVANLASVALASLKYEVRDGRMFILSTYTPPEFRGRGVATKLLEQAIRYAQERGYKVVSVCSFAADYFKKHKELRHLLDEESKKVIE